jgi:hypothetical protein
MTSLLKFGLPLFAACAVLSCNAAADDNGTITRPVDARVVRVKLDGVIDLRLRQGAVPSLTISGEQRYLDNVEVRVRGDTVTIETDSHGVHNKKSGLRADMVLPNLSELTTDGVGMAEVTGFSGERLELELGGAGTMKVNADYRRVSATLGGVGSMNLVVNRADGVTLDLGGAGYITLAGSSKMLKASMSGLGGLNAQQFQADKVDLDLSGLGNASVSATQDVNLDLSGLGSVTVYGKPLHRNVSVDGLGRVSWK